MNDDLMQLVADSRPARLDPGRNPGPAEIMAHPRRTPATARRRRRLVLAGATPAVALAIAGAVIVGTGVAQPDNPAAKPPATTGTKGSKAAEAPTTAREVLLVAAAQTSHAPTTGRYWRTQVESGERTEVGPAAHPYAIMRRSAQDRWLPTGPATTEVLAVRSLGAKPAGDADEAAWKADGSPRQWTQKGPDGLPDVVISMAPGERFVKRVPAEVGLLLGGTAVTPKQLAALPADPGALRAWLLDRFAHDGGQEPTDYRLFMSGRALVADLPVSPAVRAAAFRMLAGVNGVRLLGPVTDQHGRSGTAVAYVRGANQSRLIVDGGRVLAEESWHAGTLMSYSLVAEAGFTDDNPPS
ncbi:CU044_5270 family protein [Actinoplanes sp. CA-142083]|uniref:CU044_5270 family protein n=1 Tax=Actinoplanes sp. CA-142083 TaxID=3239903 RepID=UPI003D8E81E1